LQGDLPPEFYELQRRNFDKIFTCELPKGFWNWRSFIVAMLGVSQIVAGVFLEIWSAGALTQLSSILISEGIGDILFAIQSAVNNNFDWKNYANHKVSSIMVSCITGVASVAISPASAATKTASIIETIFHRTLSSAVKISGFTAANHVLGKMFEKLPHEINLYFGNTIRKHITHSPKANESAVRVRKTIVELFSTTTNSELARSYLDKVMNQVMSSINNNVLSQIASEIPTILISVGENMASHMSSGSSTAIVFINIVIRALEGANKFCDLIDLVSEKLNGLDHELKSTIKKLKASQIQSNVSSNYVLPKSDESYIDKFIESQKDKLTTVLIQRMCDEIAKPNVARVLHRVACHLSEKIETLYQSASLDDLNATEDQKGFITSKRPNADTIDAEEITTDLSRNDIENLATRPARSLNQNMQIVNQRRTLKEVLSNSNDDDIAVYKNSRGEFVVETTAFSRFSNDNIDVKNRRLAAVIIEGNDAMRSAPLTREGLRPRGLPNSIIPELARARRLDDNTPESPLSRRLIEKRSAQNPNRINFNKASYRSTTGSANNSHFSPKISFIALNMAIEFSRIHILIGQEKVTKVYQYQKHQIELDILISKLKLQDHLKTVNDGINKIHQEANKKLQDDYLDKTKLLLNLKITKLKTFIKDTELSIKVSFMNELDSLLSKGKDIDTEKAFQFLELHLRAFEKINFHVSDGTTNLKNILSDIVDSFKKKFVDISPDKLKNLYLMVDKLNIAIKFGVEFEEKLEQMMTAHGLANDHDFTVLKNFMTKNGEVFSDFNFLNY
jgi:hypothetical protein